MVPWSILNWMILLTIFQPAVSVLQYSAVELLQFRFNRYPSPPNLHFYTDISKPRRKYIHRGSRRNYTYVDSNSIKSFWSSSSRSTRKLDRTADHSVLAHLGKSTITESTTNVFTFGLLNIRSINNKVGVDRYVFFRADTDTDYYRSSRPITDILNRYTCLV